MIFAVLDSRNLLFSEAAQAVYELDDFSAYVWRSLDSGLTRDDIASEMIEAGADPRSAHAAIAAAVQKLQGVKVPELTSTFRSSPPAEQLTHMMLTLAGVTIQLNLSAPLAADVSRVFGYLESDSQGSHVQFSASLAGGTVFIRAAGQLASSCERSEFLPVLKALLIESVLQYANYEVALHAAALVRDENALLLLGSPGAGKTTLAIALLREGFNIAADDVVLVGETGLLSGLPLPFTVKESAWSMLAPDWPQLQAEPVHRRPDGIRVCYLQHQDFARSPTLRMRFAIQLDRQAGAPASLQPVDAVSALEALIGEGHARNERLTENGFRSLVNALRDTRSYRLTYSDLSEAARAVSSICS